MTQHTFRKKIERKRESSVSLFRVILCIGFLFALEMLNSFIGGNAVNLLIDLFFKNINITNMRLTVNTRGRRRCVLETATSDPCQQENLQMTVIININC